jgi:hypothetical protein
MWSGKHPSAGRPYSRHLYNGCPRTEAGIKSIRVGGNSSPLRPFAPSLQKLDISFSRRVLQQNHSRDELHASLGNCGITAFPPSSNGKTPVEHTETRQSESSSGSAINKCPNTNVSSYRFKRGFGKFSCKLWRGGYSRGARTLAW